MWKEQFFPWILKIKKTQVVELVVVVVAAVVSMML